MCLAHRSLRALHVRYSCSLQTFQDEHPIVGGCLLNKRHELCHAPRIIRLEGFCCRPMQTPKDLGMQWREQQQYLRTRRMNAS